MPPLDLGLGLRGQAGGEQGRGQGQLLELHKYSLVDGRQT